MGRVRHATGEKAQTVQKSEGHVLRRMGTVRAFIFLYVVLPVRLLCASGGMMSACEQDGLQLLYIGLAEAKSFAQVCVYASVFLFDGFMRGIQEVGPC